MDAEYELVIIEERRQPNERRGKARNLDHKRRAEQEELVRRLLEQPPAEDDIRKWRREGEEMQAARAKARAERLAAEAPDWNAIFGDRVEQIIQQERTFIFQCVGSAIGELLEKQSEKDKKDLQQEIKRLWAVLNEVQKTINEFNRSMGKPTNRALPNSGVVHKAN
jgi:hypothetical protein